MNLKRIDEVRRMYSEEEMQGLGREIAESLVRHVGINIYYCPMLAVIVSCYSLTGTEMQKIIEFAKEKNLNLTLHAENDLIEIRLNIRLEKN